jgi:hypothetical protein
VLGGRAHRELVHVGLAQRDQVSVAEPLHDGGVVGRDPALEDFRAGRGRHVLGGEHVLDGDRDTREGSQRVAGGAAGVDLRGRGQRGIPGDVEEGVQVGVDGRDVIEMRAGDLDGADRTIGEQAGERRR